LKGHSWFLLRASFLIIGHILACMVFLLACGGGNRDSAESPAQQAESARAELILCGWDEVFILELSHATDVSPGKLWSWKAADCLNLPDSMKSRFATTDECKVLKGGGRILITSSSDGVALVEREGGSVLFYALAANAHSAEFLPGERIAVAASHRAGGGGDRLIVFDLDTPGKELCSCDLPWGHGVVWDEQRELLWALADKDIRVFELKNWQSANPSLERVDLIELPESGGHDFSPVPGTEKIALSTSNHCWLFDRLRRSFEPHPELAEKPGVKCISYNPSTGQVAWVQAEGENWWAERVRFLHPEHTLRLPGRRLYKARWNIPKE
jgi:hypothetical protein